jgi:flavin reductase (DIM6/NTAB) family NADH-FMN oxidoreductase RutF
MIVDCKTESSQDIYKILVGCVVPRPIAWVSSQSAEGGLNLAPFSFFNAFSADPPIIGLGIGMKSKRAEDGSRALVPKDTLKNILETKEFVVNVVSYKNADRMNRSSAEFDPDISEFDQLGLTPTPSEHVNPPCLNESMISMECKLFQHIELPRSSIILGEVLCFHIKDEVWDGHGIIHDVLQPIGRLAGSAYCKTETVFDMPRPRI